MQASRDQNRIKTVLGVSNADGITTLPVYASPSSHAVVLAASSGTMPVRTVAERDQNRVTSVLAVSQVDDTTPIAIGVDSITNGIFVEFT